MEAMEIKALIENDSRVLLDEYDYPVSQVRDVIDKAWDAKADLRAILSKHPNWDERQQAIVFNANFDTLVDSVHVSDFCNWVDSRLNKQLCENPDGVILNYHSLTWSEYDMCTKQIEMQEDGIFIGDGKWVRRPRYERIHKFRKLFNKENFESNVVTQEFVDAVMECGDDSIVPVVGQKTSRAVMKICKALGLTEIKDIQTIRRNGEYVEKDYGWNYYFAMFGDAINPLHITRYTVISINPLDYWTMSFGTDWASCQTIDLENLRDMDQTHEGMYSSGTESYMLDGSTVIMYTVSPGYNGEMWRADKERRMNFHIAPDGKAMVFGRLYPDGRDGGETGLAAQFRKTVQKVLSECIGENNLWVTKKGGNSATREFVTSNGTNYRDYLHYEDTGISYLKETQMPRIMIGAEPVCPGCGKTHSRENNITCYSCNGGHGYRRKICYRCDCNFDENEGFYCEDNGHWYCCSNCAENDDLVWTYDDDQFHETENCCYDEWNREWYFMNWEDGVSPDGCLWYHCEDNAEKDGWVKYDGDWYREDDMVPNDLTGEMIPIDEAFSPDDFYHYLNEDEAKKDGWVEKDDGWERVA